eukprot:GILJ01004464.1.p1 GENE.GILJ01004464.1~~GILJ01004464.1.p1  ORF type:complete len:1153 (-),score=184.26 GILJ01004464.1:147-3605(-)
MAKYAEKLIVLTDAAQGVLTRLHLLKTTCINADERTSCLRDRQLEKIVKSFVQSFPDAPRDLDKIAGYEQMQNSAKSIREELQEAYWTIKDALEFREAAYELLEDMAKNIISFKLDKNPDLMIGFMDVLVSYLQIHMLFASIADAKAIVSLYSRAYLALEAGNEPNYSRVAVYVQERSVNVLQRIQEEFSPLSLRVGDTLMTLEMPLKRGFDPNFLRKDGFLNPVADTQKALVQPVTSHLYIDLQYLDKFQSWVLYGFLACPNELQRKNALDLLAIALADGFSVPLFRNDNVQVHQEYEALFLSYKNASINLSKHKKLLSEAANAAVAQSGKLHRERRTYLRLELENLITLFDECPGLLGPKIQVVYTALSLARSEVLWLLRHVDAAPPKAKSKYRPEDFQDPRIAELVILIDSLVNLVLQNRTVVQNYYVEFLKGQDLHLLSPLISDVLTQLKSSLNVGVQQLMQTFNDDLKSITADSDLEHIRLNHFRLSAYLSSAQTGSLARQVEPLMLRLNTVVAHTRSVDRVEQQLKEFGNLALFWWYKVQFKTIFRQSLVGQQDQPTFCVGFLRLLHSFLANVHKFCPDEHTKMGFELTAMASQFLEEIGQRCDELLYALFAHALSLDRQVSPQEAFNAYQRQVQSRRQKKQIVEVFVAGAESNPSCRHVIADLRRAERNLQQICVALTSIPTLVVYNVEFQPTEMLRQRLGHTLSRMVHSIAVNEGGHGLARPSALERKLHYLLRTFKSLDQFIPIDLDEIMRDVLLGHAHDATAGPIGKALDVTTHYSSQALAHGYSDLYSKLIAGDLSGLGVFYSPHRHCFLSLRAINPNGNHAEEFCDMNELKALCRLLGPYGIRVLDRELLRALLPEVIKVKEFVIGNENILGEFVTELTSETLWYDRVRRMRGVDSLTMSTITLGNILQFRELLHTSLNEVLSETIPFILEPIRVAHELHPENTFMSEEYMPLDLLAKDAGIAMGVADQDLKAALMRCNGVNDSRLWYLLPYAFAASLTSNVWKNAQFRVRVDAYLNNEHLIGKTVITLLTYMTAIASTDKTTSAPLDRSITTFLNAASTVVLWMKKYSTSQFKEYPVEAMFLFLDHVARASDRISNSSVEKVFPYAFIRGALLRLYEEQRVNTSSTIKDTDAVQEAAAQ